MSTIRKRDPDATALVDGRASDSRMVHDRGLAYGDGLFETIRFTAGMAPLWAGHMSRLARGCRRLRIQRPPVDTLWAESSKVAGHDECIVKLILTRSGGRGYAGVAGAKARRIVLRYPLIEPDRRVYREGLRLRWCRLRLAAQPALAGLKHLNRLEQVLARAEWTDPRIGEGLLRDAQGWVIGATAANIFAVRAGRLFTPCLDQCGVAGVARAWIVAQARTQMPVEECRLAVAELEDAEEIFLSNAVRGIVPVRAIGTRRYDVGSVTRRLGYTLAAEGIGWAPEHDTER